MIEAAVRLAEALAPSISDPRVLEAIASVPRDRFVPAELRANAYDNVALPIGCGQTISQPLVLARMLQALELRGDERVLDVGTGSGYHAALLARLAGRVYSIERYAALSQRARQSIGEPFPANLRLVVGDGFDGLPAYAPFDAINIAAAVSGAVPAALIAQLAPGGRLIAPVAADPQRPDDQRLVVIRFDGHHLSVHRGEPVRFVPLVPGAPPRPA